LILSPRQYDLTIFTDGHLILENHFKIPDLFILDKQLSGVDGLDICQFLKGQSETKAIPVIMLSASPGIEKASRSAGANDALEKPFKVKALRDMVARYVHP
jgi:CheY-like chemotaxis protein